MNVSRAGETFSKLSLFPHIETETQLLFQLLKIGVSFSLYGERERETTTTDILPLRVGVPLD